MAVNTEKKSTARVDPTARRTSAKKPVEKKAAPIIKKTLPLDMMVACTNLFPGTLVYISRKQVGYEIVWENQGDVDYIELGELVSMRNSQRAFFEKNWIGIDDEDVLEYLGVQKYYDHALSYEEFNELLDMPFSEMAEKIRLLPKGMKENFKIQVSKKIKNKEIDSIKVVDFLKSELGIITD